MSISKIISTSIFVVILAGVSIYIVRNFEQVNVRHELKKQDEIVSTGVQPQEHSKSSREHYEQIRSIDGAWDLIHSANAYFAAGQFGAAADAYQQAYLLDKGSGAVSGLKLALTYEKMGHIDEGLMIIDDMISKKLLSDKGIQNADEIKSRLLATKDLSKN